VGAAERTVAAVIVTFNDPVALDSCLKSILRQTRLPETLIIVDNGSSPPAVLPSGLGPQVELVRVRHNSGPAGGFADGLDRFLRTRAELAWVMDDDCRPRPAALAQMLGESDLGDVVLLPTLVSAGLAVKLPAWCGVLIPRSVVAAVGTPRRDFVWWMEDTEYIQWRIPQAGFCVRYCGAIVDSDHPRRLGEKPGWKYYYEARNATYYRLWLNGGNRRKRMSRLLIRVPLGIVLRGEVHAMKKVGYHFRGVFDGVFGRLGMRVRLSEPTRRGCDRSWLSSAVGCRRRRRKADSIAPLR